MSCQGVAAALLPRNLCAGSNEAQFRTALDDSLEMASGAISIEPLVDFDRWSRGLGLYESSGGSTRLTTNAGQMTTKGPDAVTLPRRSQSHVR
jgi:hypothetical protein